MTAKILPMRKSIKEAIDEIHKQFAYAADGTKKADRARIRAGQLLNDLRERVEAGEAGENINWWKWYGDNFARSKRDAQAVMKLASSTDPEAAADQERATARASMKATRAKRLAQSEIDLVTHALRLVEEMDADQRRQFFAALRRRAYADSY